MHQYVFIVNQGEAGMDIMNSLLGSIIVLALPQGAGVLLIALVSSWQGALYTQRIAAVRGVAAQYKRHIVARQEGPQIVRRGLRRA